MDIKKKRAGFAGGLIYMHAAQMVLLLGIMLTKDISLKKGFLPEAAGQLVALVVLMFLTIGYYLFAGKKERKNEATLFWLLGGAEAVYQIADFILFSKKVKPGQEEIWFWAAGIAVLVVFTALQVLSDKGTWKFLMTIIVPFRAVISALGLIRYKNEFLHPKAMIPMFVLMAVMLVVFVWTGEKFSLVTGLVLGAAQIVASIFTVTKLSKSSSIMQALTGFIKGKSEKQLLFVFWIIAASALAVTAALQFIKHYEIVGKMLSITAICLMILLYYAIGGIEAEVRESFGVDVADAAKNAVYGLFVRTDDPAQKLSDAVSYRIAVHGEHDESEVSEAVGKLNEMAGISLKIVTLDNLSAVGSAFYNREVDAVFIERSTATYIDSDFETREIAWVFSEETRVIADVSVALKENQQGNPGTDPDPIANPTEEPVKTPAKEDLTKTPFVVYVSGIDVYGDIKTKSRSDVNVLVAVNPNTKEIALVTTPRDAYVDIPGKTSEYRDKLTHAGNYGVQYSISTLENLYGIKVDYYVRINFSGVEKIVNLLGGVDVVSLYNFTARHGPYEIKKGVNHMNGAQAVSFARERITVPGGDVTRGKHHIELIKGIFAKITTTAVLTNYQSLLDAASDNFQTDVSTNQLASLAAMQLSDGAEWYFTSYASYGDGATKMCNSYRGGELWVCLLKKDSVKRAAGLINRVLNGEHIPDDEYKYEQ
ncbi:MAG: LCP family protein [Lachnospiraceae bacterium]|nr:LCP family protein [Lachnospiraceae bacterium]